MDSIGTGEKYEFTWAGKRLAAEEAAAPSHKRLCPCPAESRGWEGTKNLYLEGDNLDALKLLREEYRGAVQLIYLDPPYNTRNDFVYCDDFTMSSRAYAAKSGKTAGPENGGRLHSDWCSMMYARLLPARDLLAENGLIFLSIGDEEVANLRKICDEVFGEENFRNQIIVRRGAKSVQAQFQTWDKLGQGFEYILLYSKTPGYRFPKQTRPLEKARGGAWNSHWRGTDRPTMRYLLLGVTPERGQWRWSRKRSEQAVETYRRMLRELGRTAENITQEEIDAWYGAQPGATDLLRLSASGRPEHYVPPADTTLLNSSWMDLLVGSSAEIRRLFGGKVFDTAKLTAVVERMLRFAPQDATVLDFFSGSATTAQAVMQRNAADGGSRRFILVQTPEECSPKSEAARRGYRTICDIGKERIRLAGDRILAQTACPGQCPDVGFRVYRLEDGGEGEKACFSRTDAMV